MSRAKALAPKLADLPRLRDLAGCLQSMGERVDRWRCHESNAGMQLAYGLVRDQLRQEYDSIQRQVRRLEGQRAQVSAGAGRSPAVMGHGCPALPSAVGPAAASLPDGDITVPANRLFAASALQELPKSNREHNLNLGGEQNA